MDFIDFKHKYFIPSFDLILDDFAGLLQKYGGWVKKEKILPKNIDWNSAASFSVTGSLTHMVK